MAALGWGGHDFLARLITPGARILPQVAVVMAIAALVMSPGLFQIDWAHVTAADLLLSLCVGLVYFGAAWSLYAAFARAPARVVVPVIAAYPLPALMIAAALGQPVGLDAWLAAVLIALGLAVGASGERQGPGTDRLPALGFALLACLGLGISLSLGQASVAGLGSAGAAALPRVVAALAALAVLALRREGVAGLWGQRGVLTAMGLLDGIALTSVVLAGGLAEAHYASVASALYGMVTVALTRVFLKEMLNNRQILGLGLVFVGISLLAWG